jgi:hypothetical protein
LSDQVTSFNFIALIADPMPRVASFQDHSLENFNKVLIQLMPAMGVIERRILMLDRSSGLDGRFASS